MSRWAIALACLAAAAAYFAFRGSTGPAIPVRPNVLLVTIDTLRTDAIGEGQATPGINAFLAEATRYAKARTVTPLTLPAHVSMLTGLFPGRHAIHDNVSEPLPPKASRPFPLLAEELRDSGYATAAFVACSVLGEATGIASGFDVYDCPPGLEGWNHGGNSTGEARVRAATEWIAKAPPGKPWFVWVHMFDPHKPYLPYPGDARRPATRESDPLPLLYAGGVRRADAAFETLLAAVGPDAIVVLASDHGEGLLEHEEAEHGSLCYGPTIDAVLAVRAPGFRRGAVDGTLRSVADVAPTLRNVCGLPGREGDGRDLRDAPHAMLVAESLYAWRIHGWGQCFGVTDGDFTLVESGPRLELFDRRTDPRETQPLPFDHPAYEKLDRELEAFRSLRTLTPGGEVVGSIPPYGAIRRLDSGSYLPRHRNTHLLDVRANLADWTILETIPAVIGTCLQRRDTLPVQDVLRILRDFERKWPDSPRVSQYRAGALRAMFDLTRSRSWLKEAIRAQLDTLRKGFVEPETILPAIDFAVEARDAEALRFLVGILEHHGRELDAATGKALDDACAQLGVIVTEAPR